MLLAEVCVTEDPGDGPRDCCNKQYVLVDDVVLYEMDVEINIRGEVEHAFEIN